MNKIWSRVFDNNYHKSLDHRSFYFKQVTPLHFSHMQCSGNIFASALQLWSTHCSCILATTCNMSCKEMKRALTSMYNSTELSVGLHTGILHVLFYRVSPSRLEVRSYWKEPWV